jgi:hypothetical protein
VQEAAAEATALQRRLSQEADDKLLAELKAKGVQVSTPTRPPSPRPRPTVDDKWDRRPHRRLRQEGDRGRQGAVSRRPGGHHDGRCPRRATGPGTTAGDKPCRAAEPGLIERAIVAVCARACCGCPRAVIFVILVANTVLRYATGSSLQWANEVPELLFPWLVMAGVVLAAEHGAHIATTFLMEALPHGRTALSSAPPAGLWWPRLYATLAGHLAHARDRARREVAHPAAARLGHLRLRDGGHGAAGRCWRCSRPGAPGTVRPRGPPGGEPAVPGPHW